MARPDYNFANAATTSVFTDTALDFARSWLQGYYYDYALFHNGDDYCLILGDKIRGTRYSYFMSPKPDGAFDFVVYQIDDVTGAVTYQYYHDITDYDLGVNSSHTMYSSLPDMPDLIDGGQKYDFVQTYIIICIVIFCLLDRIFKHIR